MSTQKNGYFEVLSTYPADVVAVQAHGYITGAAYEETLMPLIEERIRAEGKVKLLYIMGPDFEGFTAGAAWDDAKLGLMHLGDFARLAVVSDVDWIRMGVKMFAPLISGAVKVFPVAQMVDADAWIRDSGQESAAHDMDAAADTKILPLEDKIPPQS